MCSAERISAAANAAAVVSSARSRSRRSWRATLARGGHGAVVFAHDVGNQFVDVIAADDVFGAAGGDRASGERFVQRGLEVFGGGDSGQLHCAPAQVELRRADVVGIGIRLAAGVRVVVRGPIRRW